MYFLIGTSLLFTFMLAVGIAAAAVLSVAWRGLDRLFRRARPTTRARIIFGLRVLPVLLALTVALGFVVPSFVMFEPSNSGERVSGKLALIIAVAAFGISAAVYRSLGSWWRTRRLVAEWSLNAVPISIENIALPTYKLDHRFPVFAVVGVLRPRLFIAKQLLETLDQSELSAVATHELGHISAWDNLKRLMMQLCSDMLVAPIGRSLDRDWSEASESAADEFAATHGDRSTALNLAAALIKIARMIPQEPIQQMPAVSFVYELMGETLSSRVRRLLQLAEQDDLETGASIFGIVPALLLATWIVVVLATDSSFLARIHNLSELVLATLQ